MTAAEAAVFCTHFDSGYLPQGLALLASLERHAPGMRLWVLALDEPCHQRLVDLNHPSLRVLPLEAVESQELRQARANRSWGEYCWTLTPFLPLWVQQRDPGAETVIYIDADCWLAGSVEPLLAGFEASGAACMITPHAYTPHRDRTATAGTYCVQFMPFRRNAAGLTILRWWQERCLERCSGHLGQGPLGDQGYLNDWPERFGHQVFVLDQPELTLAPWNIERFWHAPSFLPCLYHFQGFRLYQLNRWLVIRASAGVPLEREALRRLHRAYLNDILAMVACLPARSLAPRPLPMPLQDPRGLLLLLPRLLVLHWVVWLRPLPPALGLMRRQGRWACDAADR
ncbi:MAG: glycosyl transferase [Cyanobacteriota bacterium]|nr:glycosyl transferase [Cyanobacteriota bacterium]